jgi:hypothetical protein
MRRCLNRGTVGTLVVLLGGLPACLNPDISDEAPLTTQAVALDADGGAPDDSDPDAEDSGRRRRGSARR